MGPVRKTTLFLSGSQRGQGCGWSASAPSLQGVREMGIALDRKLNPLHCTSAFLTPHSFSSPSPHSSSPRLLLPILRHRILWEGALQVKELIRSRETQNAHRGFTEVPISTAAGRALLPAAFTAPRALGQPRSERQSALHHFIPQPQGHRLLPIQAGACRESPKHTFPSGQFSCSF